MKITKSERNGRWIERSSERVTQRRANLTPGAIVKDSRGKILFRKPTPYFFEQSDRGGQVERNYGSVEKPDWRPLGSWSPSTVGLIKPLDRAMFLRAYAKAYNALAAWESDRVQLLVNAIEAKKIRPTIKQLNEDMLNLINEDFKAMKKRAKELRKKKKNYRPLEKGVKRFLKRVGRVNLAINFGLAPLLYSAFSFESVLKRSAFNRVTYRGRYIDRGTLGSSTNRFGFSKWENTYHVTIDGHLIVENLEKIVLEQVVGNPLETAWELIPYSWLVDYFFGISSIMENVTSLSGYRFEGYITEFAIGESQVYMDTQEFRCQDRLATQKLMTRRVLKDLPKPGIREQLIFTINPFDGHFNRARELISVLLQRLH